MNLDKTYNLQRPVLEWLINGENTDKVRRIVKYGKVTVNSKRREVEYKGNLRDFMKAVLLDKSINNFKNNLPQNIRITISTIMRDLNKVKHDYIVSIVNKGNYLVIKTHEPIIK